MAGFRSRCFKPPPSGKSQNRSNSKNYMDGSQRKVLILGSSLTVFCCQTDGQPRRGSLPVEDGLAGAVLFRTQTARSQPESHSNCHRLKLSPNRRLHRILPQLWAPEFSIRVPVVEIKDHFAKLIVCPEIVFADQCFDSGSIPFSTEEV